MLRRLVGNLFSFDELLDVCTRIGGCLPDALHVGLTVTHTREAALRGHRKSRQENACQKALSKPQSHARNSTMTRWGIPLRLGLVVVEHPIDAESIDEHAETRSPEHILKGQSHLPILSDTVEQLLGFFETLANHTDMEIFSLRPCLSLNRVRRHKCQRTDRQLRMNGPVLGFGWNVHFCFSERLHHEAVSYTHLTLPTSDLV